MNTDQPSLISLSNVTKTFPGPPSVKVLHGISLSVNAGEYVAITGPSGSGKSTLMNIIGLLDSPSTGEYLFDGTSIAGLSDAERAAHRASRIGWVFQQFHLLEGLSAAENVAMGILYRGVPYKKRIARAREALTRVGLGHRLEAQTSTMSGGERQRVAIARALVGRPALLLCDEPTGNLDSSHANMIFTLLEDLNAEGQTVVVITHDHLLSSRAQRSLLLTDGRLS